MRHGKSTKVSEHKITHLIGARLVLESYGILDVLGIFLVETFFAQALLKIP